MTFEKWWESNECTDAMKVGDCRVFGQAAYNAGTAAATRPSVSAVTLAGMCRICGKPERDPLHDLPYDDLGTHAFTPAPAGMSAAEFWPEWVKMNGYGKMAMYPFAEAYHNRAAQPLRDEIQRLTAERDKQTFALDQADKNIKMLYKCAEKAEAERDALREAHVELHRYNERVGIRDCEFCEAMAALREQKGKE